MSTAQYGQSAMQCSVITVFRVIIIKILPRCIHTPYWLQNHEFNADYSETHKSHRYTICGQNVHGWLKRQP
jgi:hypothetical protein